MCGLLSLQFYQPYFDVNTSDVKMRVLQAAWPLRKRSTSFLGEGESSQQADLYGPVWVSKADRVPQHLVMEPRAKQTNLSAAVGIGCPLLVSRVPSLVCV